MHGLFKDLAGKRFGRLTVVWPEGRQGKSRNTMWLCACDCGNLRHVIVQSLQRGATISCGCLNRERVGAAAKIHRKTHGECVGGHSSEYSAYNSARNRCNNPRQKSYKWYGGANPPVRFNFSSFEEFFAEIGKKPGREYTHDRINPFGHYEPGNVRWSTWKEQANNKRKTKLKTKEN